MLKQGVEGMKDEKKIEDVLLQAFYLDAYAGYELFTKRKMSNEERVGVFLPDLKLAFVVGLLEAVSSRFRDAKETIGVVLPQVRTEVEYHCYHHQPERF